MDKTPWIINKKTTKADLKRILEIMGVVPPAGYDAKALRELVTETHAHFMSLLPSTVGEPGASSAAAATTDEPPEGTGSAAAAADEEPAAEPPVDDVGSSSTAIVVHGQPGGFVVDFDDPPVHDDAAAAAAAESGSSDWEQYTGEDAIEGVERDLYLHLLHEKRQRLKECKKRNVPDEIQGWIRDLCVSDYDIADQKLILEFLRESVGMRARTVLRGMKRLELTISTSQSGASSSGYKGKGKGKDTGDDTGNI